MITVDTGKTYRLAGIIGLASGAAILVPGIVLAVLDGSTTTSGCNDPLYAKCRYTTMAGGAAFMAVGAAAVAAGTSLLIYGLLKKKRAPRVTFGYDPRRRTFLMQGRLEF